MPTFTFLGGPACGADSVCMYGVTLPVGVPVEVTEAFAVRKLRGNMFFREGGGSSEAGGDEGTPPASSEIHTVVKRRGRPPRV